MKHRLLTISLPTFRNILLGLILLLLVNSTDLTLAQESPNGWTQVGNGFEYQEFFVATPGPNHVYVVRMDRNNPNAIIESSMPLGKLSGAFETVSGMARRYDEALNFWGEATIPHNLGAWGGRNRVVAAINGDFSEGDNSNLPSQGQVHSGWYARRFRDSESFSGFAWKFDRSIFMGECIAHPASKQAVYIPEPTGEYAALLTGVNVPRASSTDIILYTPQYDATTLTNNSGGEVLIELSKPSMIVDYSDAITGTVREKWDGKGSTPIPFDHVVLSAGSSAKVTLLPKFSVGEEVKITHKVKKCVDDQGDWVKTYAAIGNGYNFIVSGNIIKYQDPDGQAPRTATAYNDSYVYFIVVDGRMKNFSVGMTINQLAEFTSQELLAQFATNHDGGGSSTLVVNGVVMNYPNGSLRELYLPAVARNSNNSQAYIISSNNTSLKVTPLPFSPPSDSPAVFKKENPIVNGLLMVEVLPEQFSPRLLTPGDPVQTIQSANLRLGPGTNYAVLASVPSGSTGQVVAHSKGLNGILAKGGYWWKVNFSGQTGWINEADLKP